MHNFARMLAVSVLLVSAPAFSQLAPPNASGVTSGHIHMIVSNPAAQNRFWSTLGGVHTMFGPMDSYAFPGMTILITTRDSAGGSDGSAVGHIGFKVKDFAAISKRLDAAGFRFNPEPAPNVAGGFVDGPDGVRVEIIQVASLNVPVAYDHTHLFTKAPQAMQAWYAKTFGAKPAVRNKLAVDDLPGSTVKFTEAANAAPTKGRVLDHIGFEVRNLPAFCKKLESSGVKFDAPYRQVPALGIAIAFFTDPWGTYIELTEGTK